MMGVAWRGSGGSEALGVDREGGFCVCPSWALPYDDYGPPGRGRCTWKSVTLPDQSDPRLGRPIAVKGWGALAAMGLPSHRALPSGKVTDFQRHLPRSGDLLGAGRGAAPGGSSQLTPLMELRSREVSSLAGLRKILRVRKPRGYIAASAPLEVLCPRERSLEVRDFARRERTATGEAHSRERAPGGSLSKA
ncbi:hypothetical protein AMELA_G00265820 [Ameiurus melas]|uniref:Uncharacterized protein n=1 Tax=Ameiurus melas TaxID=219545 RepID=A0A7J5ZPU5_AMEME|nr:hypothetical protein AMELA_G00265820 [Ameiurus melas]